MSNTNRQRKLFLVPPTPDPEEGERRKEESIRLVEQSTPYGWKVRANQALLSAARDLPDFTTDDIRNLMDMDDVPPEPRAMGAIVKAAARKGTIEKIKGQYRESTDPTCHRRPKQVWKKSE